MKTLAGWIAGVFALGLAIGGLYRGTSAGEVEASLANLPRVDCGPGREALYEPVDDGVSTTLRVRCVALETEEARPVAAPAPAAPLIVPAYDRTPVVVAPAPAPAPVATRSAPSPDVRDVNVREERESRSWEKSALIIGSSAGAGAGIGALAKGGKGAVVGAAIGGVAGTVYDLSTRNKK